MTSFECIFVISADGNFTSHVCEELVRGFRGYEAEQLYTLADVHFRAGIDQKSTNCLVIFDARRKDTMNFNSVQMESYLWYETWQGVCRGKNRDYIYLAIGSTHEQMSMGTLMYVEGVGELTPYSPMKKRLWPLGTRLMESLRLHGILVESRWYYEQSLYDR